MDYILVRAFLEKVCLVFFTDTSKLCLLFLISILKNHNFHLLDSQFYNSHLVQFGAYEISNQKYQLQLKIGINKNVFFLNLLIFKNLFQFYNL